MNRTLTAVAAIVASSAGAAVGFAGTATAAPAQDQATPQSVTSPRILNGVTAKLQELGTGGPLNRVLGAVQQQSPQAQSLTGGGPIGNVAPSLLGGNPLGIG